MSYKTRVEEQAVSIAKKYDHFEITEWHILFALLKRTRDTDVSSLLSDVTKKLESIKSLKSEEQKGISISENATTLLEKCSNEENADKLEIELCKSLLDVDHQVKKVTTTQQQVEVAKTLEESLSELNNLIGLDQVKTQINQLIAMHNANQVRINNGLPKVPVGLHLIFAGSPGTGKTTVARIVSQIYKSLGLLPKGHLVEVDRSRLVAGYVGQTALKVQEIINEAEGGILFIDEAYALASDSGAGFGDEAIATLVKAMEDKRDSLAVIVAGYEKPMQDFIKTNPGLKSRFQTQINFTDYSAIELLEIFKKITQSHSIKIHVELENKLKEHFKSNQTTGEKGNARYARNLFEKMYLQMSTRASADGKIDLSEITELLESDFLEENNSTKRTIGFTD